MKPGLCVLFVGFNPGERSAQLGLYYAHPNNRFWYLLHQAGFTPHQLRPEEDGTLLDYGYGLTDIVKRPSRSSSDLAASELRSGATAFIEELKTYRPKIACYNGKGVYGALTGQRKVAYGLQATSVVAGVIDFVAASPSGRSREPLQVKLDLYLQLRALAREHCGR